MGVRAEGLERDHGRQRLVDLPAPERGEIWCATVDKRRPVLVVQTDRLNRSAIGWILAGPLTSNLALAGLPGDVRLGRKPISARPPWPL